ncbi:DNA polymerase zeta [Metarhizium acridum]|nr:DNA polymerase zeta [Metarhizium acridum]
MDDLASKANRWGFNTTSTIRVKPGRHMINIWRAMRGELNLLKYTLENVAWHLLQSSCASLFLEDIDILV